MSTYIIQTSDDVPLDVKNAHRVDYQAISDSLIKPIIWIYDSYYQGWYPSPFEEGKLEFILRHQNPEGRLSWEELREQMRNQGWVRIPQLITKEYAETVMAHHFWLKPELHKFGHISKRLWVHNLPLMRLIHQNVETMINYIVDKPIKASYAFTAAYVVGAVLPKHTDRPQCEYNISMMLQGKPNISLREWPLFIEREQIVNRVELDAGDAVLYSGTRDPHWRDPMPNSFESALGVFLHFVPKDFTGSLD